MLYFPFIVWLSATLHQQDSIPMIEQSHPKIENILILGDSHLVGDFGEYLHRDLHDFHKYNVVSIGIGGAGSYHFTTTMRTFCCGSVIRETCSFDTIPESKQIPRTEVHYGSDNALIGKFFKGKLSNVIQHYNPDLVIIALGSNYTNAHEDLMKIIRGNDVTREVVWIGPMRRSNIEMRLYAIHQVIKKYPDIRFIPSEDIVGHDTITSAHYAGKSAKYWADKVIKRMDFALK